MATFFERFTLFCGDFFKGPGSTPARTDSFLALFLESFLKTGDIPMHKALSRREFHKILMTSTL